MVQDSCKPTNVVLNACWDCRGPGQEGLYPKRSVTNPSALGSTHRGEMILPCYLVSKYYCKNIIETGLIEVNIQH